MLLMNKFAIEKSLMDILILFFAALTINKLLQTVQLFVCSSVFLWVSKKPP